MSIKIHQEGHKFIILFIVLSLVVRRFAKFLSYLLFLLGAFCAYFFRDPERQIPSDEDAIVSPADGKIVEITKVEKAPFINKPAYKISIFLSLFDVHINRSPIKGKVTLLNYTPGKFLPANNINASDINEQNCILIEDESIDLKVLVKQIAGIIARRIVCWVEPGQNLEKGERIGLIRFGSRTEIYLPQDTLITTTIGSKVYGGSSIIARRKK